MEFNAPIEHPSDHALLPTKLRPPRRPAGIVTRRRLGGRLDEAGSAQLTLLSAPAGFGKTTALIDWLSADDRPCAWVSLEASENDPGLFWAYVISALRAQLPHVGQAAAAALRAGQGPMAVVAALLNELAATDDPIVLVLDDYHVVESAEIHQSLQLLVDHAPIGFRLVIAGRADPPLSLARRRANGGLLELRANDLRFSRDEATHYLNVEMGLGLRDADVESLEYRTEGWIAALQLAALSLRNRGDIVGFIERFRGDDRFVVDYLAEEVLDRQPADVRSFLLSTAVLDRLCGSLCDAVTGGAGGRAMLERLERANLFVVALDDRRQWYRYHHLFADVLRARLADDDPTRVGELHRRASAWFDHNDFTAESIQHALVGGDVDEAARLIELAARSMNRTRQELTLRRWLEALPVAVFDRRPVLTIALVGARMSTGDHVGVEALVDDVERWMDAETATIVFDHDEHRRLPAQIAMYRAGLALLADDVDATLAHAQRALIVAEPDDDLRLGAAHALTGLAHWRGGELVRAANSYATAMRHFVASDFASDVLGIALGLADIQQALGRVDDAADTLRAGLDHARRRGAIRGVADMHVALGQIALGRGALDDAEHHLQLAEAAGEHAGLPQNAYRMLVANALLLHARERTDEAVVLLDEAESVYNTDFFPSARPIGAIRARLHLDRGDAMAARRWADGSGLTVDDDAQYVREYEHITLCRVLLADAERDRPGDAPVRALLARLLSAAESGGRTPSVIEILGLQAIAGIDMTRAPQPSDALARSALIDPLSGRELDVLRLLRSELSGPEIARHLHISLNTLRTHTKNIFTKLAVSSRRAAVRRADELGL